MIFRTEGLTKTYGKVAALDGFTVSVDGGAIGLLGPNGAGKSTLIRLLLGLIRPSSGSAEVLGMDAKHYPLRIRQQIGFMPEQDAVIAGLDAVGYVAYAGQLLGMPASDALQRAHDVLEWAAIGEERYRNVETYSTGMKQKAKLAQALVHDPPLLFLDEPTSGLDPAGRDEMLTLIRSLAHEHGKHVIFSTHILPDVESVCDRALVMSRGRLVSYQTIAELRHADEAYLEVRVKGDRARFVRELGSAGFAVRADLDDAIEVRATASGPKIDDEGAASSGVLQAAVRANVQVRHMARGQVSLEEVFARLVGT